MSFGQTSNYQDLLDQLGEGGRSMHELDKSRRKLEVEKEELQNGEKSSFLSRFSFCVDFNQVLRILMFIDFNQDLRRPRRLLSRRRTRC